MIATAWPRATILVVDDEPSIRDLTRDVLAEEGYRVIATATHDQALMALAAFQCALVLSDTGGSSEGGEEARWTEPERIRAAAGAVPVVIFSAHDPDIFAAFHERGFAGVIAKPFDLDDFLATVLALLGK